MAITTNLSTSTSQTDLAPQASTALEPEEQEADMSNPDPGMSDPEPDWLIDSDEEFAIALDIENAC